MTLGSLNHILVPLLALIGSVAFFVWCACREVPGERERAKQAFMAMCACLILGGLLRVVPQLELMRGEALDHVRRSMAVYGTFVGGVGTGMAIALALTGAFRTFRRGATDNTDAAAIEGSRQNGGLATSDPKRRSSDGTP